jgi:hypothetical protein
VLSVSPYAYLIQASWYRHAFIGVFAITCYAIVFAVMRQTRR